jgi:hypothetical protein
MTKLARKTAANFAMQDGVIFQSNNNWDLKDGLVRFWNLPNPFDFQRQGFPTIHAQSLTSWDPQRSRLKFEGSKDYWIQKVQ